MGTDEHLRDDDAIAVLLSSGFEADKVDALDLLLVQGVDVATSLPTGSVPLHSTHKICSINQHHTLPRTTHYVLLLCSFKEQLQQDVRIHAMEAQYAYVDSLKLAGNGKEVWVFDIDKTTLFSLPYYAKHGFGDDCVFLEGPSGAKNLELIADYVMVYRMDIKWYPTFSKLKTLLLGHWCMDDDFYGLIYFLKNSPILERFTLELYKPFEHAYGIMSGTYQPKDQVLVSKHLKAFEINHRSTILNFAQASVSSTSCGPDRLQWLLYPDTHVHE
ncbi:hypothetical protein ZWY2020_057645 [Hordeum vulgare]|nr:hypothetical protein ZWY2020_057645 [Hordeum vulgare]